MVIYSGGGATLRDVVSALQMNSFFGLKRKLVTKIVDLNCSKCYRLLQTKLEALRSYESCKAITDLLCCKLHFQNLIQNSLKNGESEE
jgi:hypothetical protein